MIQTEVKPKILPFCEVLGDGSLKYNLTPPQMRAMKSEAKVVALLCGAQFGKTILGPPWLNMKMLKYGPGDYLAGTTNFPLLDKKMLPAYEDLFTRKLGVARYKEKGNKLVWNDGKSTVFFCTAEKPSSMESATAIAAHFDEVGQDEWKERSWDAAQSRLAIASNPVSEGGLGAGDILITTTLYNFGWLKYKIYDEWERGNPLYEVIHADSIENPTFPIEKYYYFKSMMSASEFDLRYRGRYTRPKGLVYDCFDSKNSVINRAMSPVQDTWPVYCGMDFGNDTAAVFYSEDPHTGLFYCIAEYLGTGKTTAEHVEALNKICPRERIIKCTGGKGDKGEDGWRNDFTNAGWPVQMPSIRDVEVGISRIYAFHKLNRVVYYLDEVGILAEKTSYSRKLDPMTKEPTDEIEGKQRYHFMDAERACLGEINLSIAGSNKIKMWSW